jgi:hypothetical protein
VLTKKQEEEAERKRKEEEELLKKTEEEEVKRKQDEEANAKLQKDKGEPEKKKGPIVSKASKVTKTKRKKVVRLS